MRLDETAPETCHGRHGIGRGGAHCHRGDPRIGEGAQAVAHMGGVPDQRQRIEHRVGHEGLGSPTIATEADAIPDTAAA